jgi:hypothetical protein
MSTNPLIQDLIENDAFPSVSVALPSGGRWYDDTVLMKGIDPLDVPVGVLGILAEHNYRDPWLMLSGEAIPRMMKGVCPAVLKAGELCELDLETILLASRLVSYGPTLELQHSCEGTVPKTPARIEEEQVMKNPANPESVEVAPNTVCGHTNKISIDLNEHILRYAVIEDEQVDDQFTYHLKRVNQTVHLRLPAYNRAISMMKESVARDKSISSLGDISVDDMIASEEAMAKYSHIIDMASDTALDNIAASIYAISTTDGQLVNGQEFIREWLLMITTDEAEGISAKINTFVEWMQTFSTIKYNCAQCDSDQDFRLELDANRLFGPAGDSTQPKKPSPKSKNGVKRRKIQ